MRRLASLSLERRARRAAFSRSSSPASFILSTSVQAWPTRGSPGPARPGALIIGVVWRITQERLVLDCSPICINYTDFPQPSPSYSLALCPNLRRGDIHLGFDKLSDGMGPAVAAARVAVSSAPRSAFRRGLAQTPLRFSLCSNTRAKSGSYRQARPSPIAAPSQRAPEATGVLERRLPAGFARPALTRNSPQPCTTRPWCVTRRSPRTPGINAHLATQME